MWKPLPGRLLYQQIKYIRAAYIFQTTGKHLTLLRCKPMIKAWGNENNLQKGEYHMEESGMTEKEQAAIMIDIYTDLQRIQKAEDKEKELNNQIRKAKAKLEALGIVTENLVIE